jgi:ParB family chromosome partitioning protein
VKLEEAGFNRQVIGSSLAVSKTELSGMISVATKIPRELILAVGAAPGIGRPRWHDLTEIFKLQKCFDKASEIIAKARVCFEVIGRAVPNIAGESLQERES